MKISQREARRLRQRVAELEGFLAKQRNAYCSEWPSEVVVARFTPDPVTLAQIHTARKLEHAVVAVIQGQEIAFFASKLTKG